MSMESRVPTVENWSAWTNTELDLRLLDPPKRSPTGLGGCAR